MTRDELDQLMPPMGENYLYMKGMEGNAFYIWVNNGELHIRNIGLINEQINASNCTFSASCTESIRQLLNEAREEPKKSKR